MIPEFSYQLPPPPFAYKNITISGLPGAGSTTLLKHLKMALEEVGWHGFSGGEFMRAYAIEQGLFGANATVHHSATVYNDDFDRQVDYGMREKLSQEKGWILESWLSGFLAQGVDGVLKVLMTCSNKAVRVDRIVNRDTVSPEEAIEHMNQRYEENLAKWRRLYEKEWQEWVVKTGMRPASAPIDFWHPSLYDVVIDTYSLNQIEATQAVLDALKPSPTTGNSSQDSAKN